MVRSFLQLRSVEYEVVVVAGKMVVVEFSVEEVVVVVEETVVVVVDTVLDTDLVVDPVAVLDTVL